jgi:hypothetical protein
LEFSRGQVVGACQWLSTKHANIDTPNRTFASSSIDRHATDTASTTGAPVIHQPGGRKPHRKPSGAKAFRRRAVRLSTNLRITLLRLLIEETKEAIKPARKTLAEGTTHEDRL